MNVEATLRGVEIFSGLGGRQLARLAKWATFREFSGGTRILKRGDPAAALYVITRGRVLVTLPDEESGDERTLGELSLGAVFGEIALIDGGSRSANIMALEPTECLMISRWDFCRELLQDPEIGRAMLPVLCARIRLLQERLLRYEAEASTD